MSQNQPDITVEAKKQCKVALTGDVALEVVASYFRDAGYNVMPQDVSLDAFCPDFVYDVTSHDDVLSKEIPGFYDERMKALSGCKYSIDGIRAIVDEFGWLVCSSAAWRGAMRKVVAVDADNTLWTGILSEDGAKALVPCSVFQKGLAALRDDGVIVALLSKNDGVEGTGAPVDTGLFSASRVNWSPKPGNLVEICRELNLSPDSVVFVDDNAHERAQMAAHLPEVAVAPWNGWRDVSCGKVAEAEQRQLVRRLKEYFFGDSGLTDEDRLRAADYAARKSREAARLNCATRDEYLDSLGLWVVPSEAKESDLDRLAQMAGKTNQFNATTIRRTRDDFVRLLATGPEKNRVFVFRAGDRFGEQGLVCYIVVDVVSRRITDFVMSCRAMGRTLEHFALGRVADKMGYMPEIDFAPTAKNAPFAAFLSSIGNGLATHYREKAKRVVLFAGHYGSGKTNIAISYARWLRRSGMEGVSRPSVTVADLDIVNPYFRTKDSAATLAAEGIDLVVSEYANSNVDFPALPKEIYALVAGGGYVVMDIGGDDRGALALGRYAADLRQEGDFEMIGVVNLSRPLTRTPEDAVAVLREIEATCGLPFTGIVNNTNLGQETTASDVLDSIPYADEVSRLMGVPVLFTCCAARLRDELADSFPAFPAKGSLFPMDIQKLYYQCDENNGGSIRRNIMV